MSNETELLEIARANEYLAHEALEWSMEAKKPSAKPSRAQVQLVRELNDAREIVRKFRNVQAFFNQLAQSARAPHCGGHYREWVQAMLLRATEAGLYSPEKS